MKSLQYKTNSKTKKISADKKYKGKTENGKNKKGMPFVSFISLEMNGRNKKEKHEAAKKIVDFTGKNTQLQNSKNLKVLNQDLLVWKFSCNKYTGHNTNEVICLTKKIPINT